MYFAGHGPRGETRKEGKGERGGGGGGRGEGKRKDVDVTTSVCSDVEFCCCAVGTVQSIETGRKSMATDGVWEDSRDGEPRATVWKGKSVDLRADGAQDEVICEGGRK